MLRRRATDLPVEASAGEVTTALAGGDVILMAEPGAGKSSIVPLLATVQPGRVVVLEPRRLAARATAQRLGALLDPPQPVGDTVGLTMRGVRSVRPNTRIEVVTEAILTNRLQRDPELEGVGTVIFDEFHERNLHSDLALAMLLESRHAFSRNIHIVIMSATLQPEPLVALFESAGSTPNVVTVHGRRFDVTTEHRHRPAGYGRDWAEAVADTTRVALSHNETGVLVFAPGRRELALVEQALAPAGVPVSVLHGGSSKQERIQAFEPTTPRRVLLATAIAETSITVPHIDAVVDGGWERRAAFDTTTGLGRLETVQVTRFAADQRRGRAGRLGPGHCWRLWSAEDDRHLETARPPEITVGDPLTLAFELAVWGDPMAESLPLLDRPSPHRLTAGRRLLESLRLIDGSGRPTPMGQAARRLGTDPRLAALLLGAPASFRPQAAAVAAHLESDEPRQGIDLLAEVDRRNAVSSPRAKALLRRTSEAAVTNPLDPATPSAPLDPATPSAPLDPATPSAPLDPATPSAPLDLAGLLARQWPDRIAAARSGRPGVFQLATGPEVTAPPSSAREFDRAEFIVVAEAAATTGDEFRLLSAVAVTRTEVLASHNVEWTDVIEWDPEHHRVRAERVRRVGAIVLHREPLVDPSGPAVVAALRTGLGQPSGPGLDLLEWGSDGQALRDRLSWLHQVDPAHWPDLDTEVLLERLDKWLDLSGCRRVEDLRRLPAVEGLLGLLGWERRAELDELAPAVLPTPTGGTAQVNYRSGTPVWSVRLQRLLGLDVHPHIGPASTPLVVELLSPADRPIQITTDLPGFWRGSYDAVRRDLRGRYPKHAWPTEPWLAPPPRQRGRR